MVRSALFEQSSASLTTRHNLSPVSRRDLGRNNNAPSTRDLFSASSMESSAVLILLGLYGLLAIRPVFRGCFQN